MDAMNGRTPSAELIFSIAPLLSAFCVRIPVACGFRRCISRMFAAFNHPPQAVSLMFRPHTRIALRQRLRRTHLLGGRPVFLHVQVVDQDAAQVDEPLDLLRQSF
ncbi:hypothetical protein IHN32_01250 [Deinococcus sp. 14RED07]|uniref:hypothetical protein n=1 Tax=unclassified Deinococcus TaxID=2623546 RepID=UPI001E575ED4|nr:MULTISPECIES: hypothetical protein [unclassified Deinococcus]MCD0163151.1 hypothetical protein [Deinococcus sp. 6YEL10]MCD0174579.1 hypothetical protein [Deinococcus sp. 14RED07]